MSTIDINNSQENELSGYYRKRLAFAKYLITQGYQQAFWGSEIEYPCSILNFHDALDIVLNVGADMLGISKNKDRIFLLDYWKLYKKKGRLLPLEHDFTNLNRDRINLKHHAKFPSREDCQRYHTISNSFIEEVFVFLQDVFPVKWDDITLYSMVGNEEVARHLLRAEEAFKQKELINVFDECAQAFARFSQGYIGDEIGDLAHRFKRDIESMLFHIGGNINSKEIESALREISNPIEGAINQLFGMVILSSAGVNLVSYRKFVRLTPRVNITLDDAMHLYTVSSQDDQEKVNEETARFCIDFVLDCVLKFQANKTPVVKSLYKLR